METTELQTQSISIIETLQDNTTTINQSFYPVLNTINLDNVDIDNPITISLE